MKALLFGVALALAVSAEPLRGTVVNIHDGDTIKIKTAAGLVSVRLQNIDAPELAQPGGHESRDYLRRLAPLGQVLTVQTEGHDKYRRTLGVVWKANLNLNLEMVRNGHAWAYTKYHPEAVYIHGEAEARRSHRGVWAGPVAMAPWDWRHRPKRPIVK